ncbi:fatty acid-binding protein-like isoform X1 [Scylla paramamosain]|uniref:fatty acid-binding protein-like isoform X1 n=1 Tax=Scylla paramamosain TaxID=85552 RepID=UPI0030833089
MRNTCQRQAGRDQHIIHVTRLLMSSTDMALFEGKYQHEKSKNYEEFLKAIGVPLVPRKVVVNSSPVVEVTRCKGETSGDKEETCEEQWSIRMSTLLRDIEYRFVPGQPMQTESMGGQAKNVFTIENNRIIQRQDAPTYSTEVVREFTDDGLTMTMKHVESGIECHRYFKRIK